MQLSLDNQLLEKIPDFKIGIAVYHNIVVEASPQMLKGRLEYFQETIRSDLRDQSIIDYPGVQEWQDTFKTLGIDPKRYRPSHEALFRRISQGKDLPFIHSAVDINNFFSLQYEIPIGIYNLNALHDYIKIRLGTEEDRFEGLNGRENSMKGKLISTDQKGAFGSPVVDSVRTSTEPGIKKAVQIFYLKPSLAADEAEKLINAAAGMFTQLHGGSSTTRLLYHSRPHTDIWAS